MGRSRRPQQAGSLARLNRTFSIFYLTRFALLPSVRAAIPHCTLLSPRSHLKCPGELHRSEGQRVRGSEGSHGGETRVSVSWYAAGPIGWAHGTSVPNERPIFQTTGVSCRIERPMSSAMKVRLIFLCNRDRPCSSFGGTRVGGQEVET